MHGYVNVSFIATTSNPIAITATSNFTTIVSDFAEVQM
jgi:hypothetical protein